jgi:hypothetical protein
MNFLKALRYNKTFRNFILYFGHKYPNLIDWKKQIQAAEEIISTNNLNKNILIAPVVTSDQILTSIHSILGFALKTKGANVDFLTCNSSLDACTNAYNFAINNEEFIKHGPKKFCNSCYDCSYTLFKPLTSDLLQLSKYIDKTSLDKIDKIVKTTEIKNIPQYKIDNINIGENTLAGTLRYFARGSIDFDNFYHNEILKKYFKSALVTKLAMENLLNKKKYDTVVIDHGLYIPQGIVGEVARNFGCSVKVIWVGYKRNTMMIVDNITYHKSLITENKANWMNYEFDNSKEKKLMNYLEDRDSGKQDWEKFNNEPINSIEILKKEKKIDGRPIISLMTNVIWDAQLKFDQNIFINQMEWITKTVEYFEDRKDLQLVIRVHPAEARADMPANEKIKDALKEKFIKLPENIKLIDGTEKFSSYTLSSISKAVIVYATKLSFELPCFGQNVIICGEAFAKNKGFTIDPESRDEYFKILDNVTDLEKLNEKKIKLARRYSYHFFFRKSMEIKSLITRENKYPPFKLKKNFHDIVKNKKDDSIEALCKKILFNKETFLE